MNMGMGAQNTVPLAPLRPGSLFTVLASTRGKAPAEGRGSKEKTVTGFQGAVVSTTVPRNDKLLRYWRSPSHGKNWRISKCWKQGARTLLRKARATMLLWEVAIGLEHISEIRP